MTFESSDNASPLRGAAARRAQNRQEMRIAILDAARGIVDQQGAEKLTLRGIAQALGYSAGAIYDYFASKEQIVHALYFEGTGGMGQHIAQETAAMPADTPTIEAITTLAHAYRAYAHAHVELYWLAFSGLKERPVADPEFTEDDAVQGGFGPLLDLIIAGVSAGVLVDSVPPLAIAVAAWSGVHGFVSLELGGHLQPAMDADRQFRLGSMGSPGSMDGDISDAQIRDDLFDVLTRTLLYGFVRR
jgi:AcrR family transcriptional regulator